jgi:hypothetical protein
LTIQKRIDIEQQVIVLAKQRAKSEAEAESVARLRLTAEQRAIEAITARMDTELAAIEADNECFEREVRTQEIAAAKLAQAQAFIATEKAKEAIELRALNMLKMKVDTLKSAIRTKENSLQADARLTVAVRQRVAAGEQSKRGLRVM